MLNRIYVKPALISSLLYLAIASPLAIYIWLIVKPDGGFSSDFQFIGLPWILPFTLGTGGNPSGLCLSAALILNAAHLYVIVFWLVRKLS